MFGSYPTSFTPITEIHHLAGYVAFAVAKQAVADGVARNTIQADLPLNSEPFNKISCLKISLIEEVMFL